RRSVCINVCAAAAWSRRPFIVRSCGGANLARRLAGPAFEGVGKGADLAIAEQPRDLGNGQVAVLQLTFGEVDPQVRQNAREVEVLRRQPPAERAPAHAEPGGNLVRLRL